MSRSEDSREGLSPPPPPNILDLFEDDDDDESEDIFEPATDDSEAFSTTNEEGSENEFAGQRNTDHTSQPS